MNVARPKIASMVTDTNLFRCMYVSRSAVAGRQDTNAILLHAHEFNPARHITGGLLHTGCNFCQVLEGPEHTLAKLMQRVEGDHRHHTITRLVDQAVPKRQFAEWSMGYVELPFADQLIEPLFSARRDHDQAELVAALLLRVLKRDQHP